MIIRSRRVVLPDGIRSAEIEIDDGRISTVRGFDGPAVSDDPAILDVGDLLVLPGLVDTHVHINDPGRADWEGFESATRSAAAGGVTTLVDMPLNSIPPTTTVSGYEAKRTAASSRCHVDVGLWGGVVPGNSNDIEPLVSAGVLGFKCFLSPSGVDEFSNVTESDLRQAMPILARLGVPLLVHAELPAKLRNPAGDPRRYATWLDSRPAEAEVAAIDLMIRLAREYGARVHIVHLATPQALSLIVQARVDGVAITVETCPHYLTFSAEDVADGATAFKCAPPIRGHAARARLWTVLEQGHIDLIATDHSPAPAALKHLDDGDFLRAWGGIASLQLGLSAVWTGAAERNIGIDRIVEWMSAAPAKLAGLERTKGRIAAGYDADLVIFNPHAEWVVSGRDLQHRHPVTPYEGLRFRGKVQKTILRGEVVFDRLDGTGQPRGRLITPMDRGVR